MIQLHLSKAYYRLSIGIIYAIVFHAFYRQTARLRQAANSTPKAKARDNSKDAYLKKCGYKIIRFTDIEIKENIHACVDKIKELFT